MPGSFCGSCRSPESLSSSQLFCCGCWTPACKVSCLDYVWKCMPSFGFSSSSLGSQVEDYRPVSHSWGINVSFYFLDCIPSIDNDPDARSSLDQISCLFPWNFDEYLLEFSLKYVLYLLGYSLTYEIFQKGDQCVVWWYSWEIPGRMNGKQPHQSCMYRALHSSKHPLVL